MSIRIPASIDEAVSSLNGLAALLTAKQWERAAIVYAFTEPGNGQGARQPLTENRQKLSIAAFADLGITGLRNREQVAAYRRAWQSAIDDGQAQSVAPGDVAEPPGLPWKEVFGEPTRDVQERIFRSVVRDPEQFRAALQDSPEIVEAVAQRVVEVPATRLMAQAKLAEPIRERDSWSEPRPEPRRDYGDDLIRGINLLIPVVRAVQRGEWQPSPAEAMLLHSLGMLLDQAASPEAAPQDDLFRRIERYMKDGSN